LGIGTYNGQYRTQHFLSVKIAEIYQMTEEWKIRIKQIFFWGVGCAKRGLLLLLPIFLVTMLLIDILTLANHDYPDNPSVFVFEIFAILFYLSCLYCILVPFKRWNKALFIVSCCLLVGMCQFNPDIKMIFQHSRCIASSSVPCPDGVVLGGG